MISDKTRFHDEPQGTSPLQADSYFNFRLGGQVKPLIEEKKI